MRLRLIPPASLTFLASSFTHAAQVAVLTGNHIPTSGVIEAPNTLSYQYLFTTVVFSGTGWVASDGFLKMTTVASKGIWFGSHPTVGADPGAFLPGSTAAGNRLELRSLIVSGAKSWSAYFHDTDGYRGRIDFEWTENGQNRPGVTVQLASGYVTVGGPGFDPTELHDYAIHVHNGEVGYFINGAEVARGPALRPLDQAAVLVGDPTGPTPTGAGSMWVDHFSFNNAAGQIPEPGSAGMVALAAAVLASRRRR